MKRVYLAFLALSIYSCQWKQEPILNYFSPQKVMEEGFANKYYHHFTPYDKNQEKRTRIGYTSAKLNDKGVFSLKYFDAGLKIQVWQYYHFQGSKLHLDSAYYRSDDDTMAVEIEAGAVKDFSDNSSSFYKESYQYEEQEHQYISHQYRLSDTLIDGQEGRHFFFNRSYRNLEKDSTLNDWKAREIYLARRGFYYGWEQGTEGLYETELIEQMPLADFLERQQHQQKRVAYIDPEKNMGSQSDFKLCGSTANIADYYNGDPDAGFMDGHRALRQQLESSLDPQLWQDFEGLLTFRFVISCEAKVGRFKAEAYDFNYQKQALPETLTKALFEFYCGIDRWQPTIIKDEARDAYAYITLKIKDGEIVDILP